MNKGTTQSIIINSSNYIGNSTFRYNFPSPVRFTGSESLGVQSISIYNSTFNITQAFGNNQFTLTWMTGATTTSTQTYTIPDSYLGVSDINAYIQNIMYQNNLYLSGVNGQLMFFLTIATNPNRYATQINCLNLPTTTYLTANSFTIPSGCPLPITSTSNNCPVTITFNNAFGSLLGFKGGTYGNMTNTSLTSYLSSTYPVINPVNNYIFGCNLISNQYQIPNNVFFSLPLNATLGQLIIQNIGSIVYNKIYSGTYNYIDIILYDNNFNTLQIQDPEMVLMLSLFIPSS